MLALVLADFEDGNDPRMLQFRRRFRFGVKPFDVLLRGKLAARVRSLRAG